MQYYQNWYLKLLSISQHNNQLLGTTFCYDIDRDVVYKHAVTVL